VFQAHRAHRGGRRSDKENAGQIAGLGEWGVLGQESITRMDRVGARPSRGVEDRG
jgi:hypothetical protein